MKPMLEKKFSREGGQYLFKKRFSAKTGKKVIAVFEVVGVNITHIGTFGSFKEAVADLKKVGITIIARPDVAERNIERNTKK